MCQDSNKRSVSTTEMTALLRSLKTELETVLSRESILGNPAVRSRFDPSVMGMFLESLVKLNVFDRFEKDLHMLFDSEGLSGGTSDGTRVSEENTQSNAKHFGKTKKDPPDLAKKTSLSSRSSHRDRQKRLMHAILLAANVSPHFDVCVMAADKKDDKLQLHITLDDEDAKSTEEEDGERRLKDKAALGNSIKELTEFLEKHGKKRIYLKPRLKTQRTTLIIRDFEDSTPISKEVILELLGRCPHIVKLGVGGDGFWSCVLTVRREIETWFITLADEELTKEVVLWLREQEVYGKKLKVGVKSEHQMSSLLSMISLSEDRAWTGPGRQQYAYQVSAQTCLPISSGVLLQQRGNEVVSVINSSGRCEMGGRGVVIASHNNSIFGVVGKIHHEEGVHLATPIPPPQGGAEFSMTADGHHCESKGEPDRSESRRKKKKKNSKSSAESKAAVLGRGVDNGTKINNYRYVNPQSHPIYTVYGYPGPGMQALQPVLRL